MTGGLQFNLRPLNPADAAAAAELIASQPDDYARFFYAFGTDAPALATTLGAVEKDVYAGLFWGEKLICVYMLRGWDAGYAVPTFGLIVDAEHRGQRVLTVALEAAKLTARLKGADRLMVKVHPDNEAGTAGALRLGFVPSSDEPETGNIIYHLGL
jgi:RimJ/RimL family protein N-acetyltransferase